MSPKQEITGSFVKFDKALNEGSIPLRGILRQIDLSRQMVDALELIATLGSSRIKGVGAVEAAMIKFTPRGLFDWHSAELVAMLSFLPIVHARSGQVNITVGLDDNVGSLKKARVAAQDVKIERADLSA